MNESNFWFIAWLVINIILTPFLAISAAFGGIIFAWGLWFLILWARVTSRTRSEKQYKKMIAEYKRKEEAKRPVKEAIIKQRIEKGLFTNESFKEYMNKRGFDITEDIDIFFDRIQHIKIETHRSKEELASQGIFTIRHMLGKYNWWFDFYDFGNGTGFMYNKIERVNEKLIHETLDDYSNVCAYAWYIPDRDSNVKIYNEDFIYCIERKKEKVFCYDYVDGRKVVDEKKKREISENNFVFVNPFSDYGIIYKYKIYRWKSGLTEKTNTSSLTLNEKKFIIQALKEREEKHNVANTTIHYLHKHLDSYYGYPKELSGVAYYDGLSTDRFFLLNNNPLILT